jgi:hypothetical protein
MNTLTNIQNDLKCPKGSYNSFGKYKYRTAEQILLELKPILLMYKATMVIYDDVLEIGTSLVMKSTIKLTVDEQTFIVTGMAGIDTGMKGMSIPQCYGSASSYARKYALNGLFLIDESEADADNENVTSRPAYTPTESQKSEFALLLLNEKITDAQRKSMNEAFKNSPNDSKTVAILNRIKELINGKFD